MLKADQAEKVLWVVYTTSGLASLVSMVCLLIGWQHWTWTLDVCINVNCGCILYGVNTFSTFMGGDVWLCHFATFGLVPSLLFGVCLAMYHGYRSCIPKSLSEPRALATASRNSYQSRGSMEVEVMVMGPRQRTVFKQWVLTAFLAVPIGGMALAHAVLITDGYYKTCEQYRRNLVRLLNATGSESDVIMHRLSCSAILDYMDYLQPDTNNYRRGDGIDTGLILQLGIFASWLNFLAWVTVFIINAYMGRWLHKLRNESTCCFCF